MKNKFLIIFTILLSLGFYSIAGSPALAIEKKQDNNSMYYTYYVKKASSKDAKNLNIFLAKYIKALNNHNLKKLRELYSTNYKSGDGFDTDEMLKLVSETWQISPDLSYNTKVKNIRMGNNFASVEIYDELTGTTRDESGITGDSGNVKSLSHNILYLQKYGKGWKIISDKVLFEKTTIKYGYAKEINLDLEVPEQVLAGSTYTVALTAEVPDSMFALGSITRESLIYPKGKSEEIFRQIPGSNQSLERVVKANKDNQNETAIASVSLCEVSKSSYTSPDINLIGTAVILRRVNVINNIASEKTIPSYK